MKTRIEADLLIPGAGDPIPNGCVVLDGPTILYAGTIEGAPPAESQDTTHSVPAVMPGLWDCHTHFNGLRRLTMEEQIYTSYPVSIIRSVKDAETALRSGFTSVRELAGTGIYLARAVNEGTIPGPHIYASGAELTPTGGHADFHALPIEFMQHVARQREYPGPCDGVPACLEAVRKVLRLGASVVKVDASGGVLSDLDSPLHQQFSDEELRAIVEEAGRAERIVAAHCHGKAGIMAALRAGAKTIEHGTYLDGEAADAMLESGAMLVPTLSVSRLIEGDFASGLPEHMLAKGRAVAQQHRRAVQLAVQRKIPIALGTDVLGSSPEAGVYWGDNGREFSLLVERGGMSPIEAIRAGTANGPLTLGPQAPKSGQLRAGYAADVIAVSEDPLKRIAVLGEPENIRMVWKDGTLVVNRSTVS